MINQQKQDSQVEPFFITEEIEAEMIAKGYTFDPPNHARNKSLLEILAALSDEKLAEWRCELADIERYKRKAPKSRPSK